MKKLVKPIAIILLGVYSFALGQDVYPYFSDPNKQTKFEDEKVYIIEKSGKGVDEQSRKLSLCSRSTM